MLGLGICSFCVSVLTELSPFPDDILCLIALRSLRSAVSREDSYCSLVLVPLCVIYAFDMHVFTEGSLLGSNVAV